LEGFARGRGTIKEAWHVARDFEDREYQHQMVSADILEGLAPGRATIWEAWCAARDFEDSKDQHQIAHDALEGLE